MTETLLKNCAYVITQNEKREVLRGCDIVIEDGKIASIKKSSCRAKRRDYEVIDCSSKIVMPSFINSHTHSPMSLIRGYKDDEELSSWLESVWDVESRMRRSDVFAGALFSCLEMIRSGTTCFVDMYFYMEDIAEAVKKAGMRAFLGYGIMDEDKSVGGKMKFSRTLSFLKKMGNKGRGLLHAVVAPHSIYTCSSDLLKKAWELAVERRKLFTIHLAETRWEVWSCVKDHGLKPAEYLKSLGLLDRNTILFHAGWLTKGEISLLAKKNVSAVHCPISNMKLATGSAFPYREMVDHGVRVAIGTDGACSNNSLNMFDEMKTAALLQKWFRWNAREMVAQQALDMVTRTPARILDLDCGAIEIGKHADLLMMDAKHYSMLPHLSVISNVVYSSTPEAVKDVMVNGRFLMRDGEVLTMDEEKVKGVFMKHVERLIE